MKKITFKMLLAAIMMVLTVSVSAQEMTNTALDTPIIGAFKVVITAAPNMDTINGAVALAPGESAAWGDLSCIVRFNMNGFIDAHNGTGYALPGEDTLVYKGDSTYTVVITGNVYTNTFTAVVTGYNAMVDSVETDTVAKDYNFRKQTTLGLAYYVKSLQTDPTWGVPGGEIADQLVSVYSTKEAPITIVTDNQPVIDGDISDGFWDSYPSNSCSTPFGGAVSGPDELSGYWKAVATADTLFVMASVKDNDLNDNNGAPSWNTDGTHFYFGLLNDRNGMGANGEDPAKVFNQFYYAADGSQPEGGNCHATRHFLVANDTGYVVEAAFAWTDINKNGVDFTPENGTQFLMDVDLVSYNTDNQWNPKQMYWSSMENCWSNMDYAGQVELAQLDTTELVAARDSLQALVDAAVVGQENGEYLPSVVEAAQAAIDAANYVLENAVTQTDLDNATQAVYAAIDAFKPNNYPIDETKTVNDFLPVIDGDISEWVNAENHENTNHVGAGGSSLFAGSWKAIWTPDTLYVMAQVVDSSLTDNGGATWYTDGVHFYFGLLNDRNGNGANGEDAAKVFSQIYYTDTTAVTGGSVSPDKVALATTEDGYLIEAAYAWTTINRNNVDFTAEAGGKILFDVDFINFYAPNYPQELYWGSDQNCWVNMDHAGRMEFSPEAVAPNAIKEDVLNDNFTMYPNPVHNVLMLNNISNVNTINIYSISGKLISRISNSGNNAQIDVSNLPAGMYLIMMDTDKGSSAKRFIKK